MVFCWTVVLSIIVSLVIVGLVVLLVMLNLTCEILAYRNALLQELEEDLEPPLVSTPS